LSWSSRKLSSAFSSTSAKTLFGADFVFAGAFAFGLVGALGAALV
jgi:hypothetical protein